MSSCQSCGAALPVDACRCPSCESATESAGHTLASGEGMRGLDVVKASVNGMAPKAVDTNVVGALTYLAGFVTGIVFLVLDPYRTNSFVRFHAFQSIFFNVAWLAFWIVWMILSAVLTPFMAGVFSLIALPMMLIFTVAGASLWIFLMY